MGWESQLVISMSNTFDYWKGSTNLSVNLWLLLSLSVSTYRDIDEGTLEPLLQSGAKINVDRFVGSFHSKPTPTFHWVYKDCQHEHSRFCPPIEPWMCLVSKRPLMGGLVHRPLHRLTFWYHHDKKYCTIILQRVAIEPTIPSLLRKKITNRFLDTYWPFLSNHMFRDDIHDNFRLGTL